MVSLYNTLGHPTVEITISLLETNSVKKDFDLADVPGAWPWDRLIGFEETAMD